MSRAYSLERAALLKILLHAAKYPTGSVNGSLAPMLETALVQVEAYAQLQGLQVLGYYHANERLNDAELGPVARRIADRIQQRTPPACAVLVDNEKLRLFCRGEQVDVLSLFLREGSRGWSRATANNAGKLAIRGGGLAPDAFLASHGKGVHEQLCDFDDHLNDIRKDWTNKKLALAAS
ncbi:hypothetical protein WJX72_010436 [[Myrmecia] bisecta]|uniref:MPN domain-containing protein n=1 Tax=[Myrmecia] bisecta TaxID=41462 RepID=A0AAW1PDI8_9CHLO